MYTPKVIDKQIKSFCRDINKLSKPRFIKVSPDKDANYLDCINNVKNFVKKNGGDVITGWAIWLHPKIFIEAEFHVVYKKNNNELIDITPHKGTHSKILFLEDPLIKYEDVQIPNIRKNISGLILVDKFIKNHDEIFKISNKGDLKHKHGEIKIKGADAAIYKQLIQENDQIMYEVLTKIKIGRNDLCLCGSGQKFKNCCL